MIVKGCIEFTDVNFYKRNKKFRPATITSYSPTAPLTVTML
jgi:hypothetical protein